MILSFQTATARCGPAWLSRRSSLRFLPAVSLVGILLAFGVPSTTAQQNAPGFSELTGDQAIAFHAGYILPHEKATGVVIGAREFKSLFAFGDVLYIRFKPGMESGLGDRVTLYRPMEQVFHPVTGAYMGRVIRVFGVVEITSAPVDRVSEARVVRSFDSFSPGDPVMPYVPPPMVPEVMASDENVTGVIVDFKVPRLLTAQEDIIYIDLGARDGIAIGDRFTVIRPGARESLTTYLPNFALAEIKVIGLQDRTATARVTRSEDALRRGDIVTRIPSEAGKGAGKGGAGEGEERVTDALAMVPQPDADELAARRARELAKRELKPIYFSFDRWDFSEKDIADAVEFLKEHPSAKLLIEGHADERGSREYNFILGEKRANAVFRYLDNLGFKNAISTVSYGKERPVCTEEDEACHSKNRRAQFVVTDIGPTPTGGPQP